MKDYQLISDYKHIDAYKESFNDLAKLVFDLDFKEWYEQGYWNDNYICYSYIDDDRIVANVSVNKLVVVVGGVEYQALQIGTVMTHPDYRHQGLAAMLMDHVIHQYEQDYDLIYLFANRCAIQFYPKFGFEPIQESRFLLDSSHLKKKPTTPSALQKLSLNNPADLELMKQFAAERIAVSSTLGVKNQEHLTMFYLILAFSDAIYYIQDEDVIVLFEQEDKELHVLDIISKRKVAIDTILPYIITDDIETVHFSFTPDMNIEGIQTELITDSDDLLFVRPVLNNFPTHFLFPITSHA
ncbi:GNAT family N-acetyltransferase [Paenibacillus sp. N1-5-1-14]|uniref:GNAT family N-acetyltransferase n=1 Tax=Paenibacillus radicibacter TaxID=2972488 RepID=UPI0021595401|nr:GNAT family N-acetyltransferase [Paenibacillus radicibacter]MCR8644313.1 GNAT family N-acetyltransferase [Paenibacillus radicibacter]